MTEQIKKPKHNEFDNIFEIRKNYPHIEEKIAEALVGRLPRPPRTVGRAMIHVDVESFIRRLRQSNFKLPVWKIVIPDLGQKNGFIYYVIQGVNERNHIFKGTYGYSGTGPHESALVEEVLERMNCMVEIRSGDYLLRFVE
jgi:hypothetical protein